MLIDQKNNITMTRGDSESITVICEERPFAEGDKITMTVKETEYKKEILFHKNVTEFEDGKAVIEIAPEDTKNLYFAAYVYDIQLTGADGTVTTIIKPAIFELMKEVTH